MNPDFGGAEVELLAPDGAPLGLLSSEEQGAGLFGFLRSPEQLQVEVRLGDAAPTLRAGWEPVFRRGYPPLALTNADGSPFAVLSDWTGSAGRLVAADGTALAQVELPDPLAWTVRLRDRTSDSICEVRRLKSAECESTGLVRGGELFSFESDAGQLAPHLVLSWAYALAMRGFDC